MNQRPLPARFVLAITAAAFLAPSLGHAKDEEPPAPAAAVPAPAVAPDEARELYAKGIQASDAGEFAAAEEFFERALKVRRAADIAANLGFVELQLNKPLEAIKHLTSARDSLPAGAKPSQRAQVLSLIEEATKKLVRIPLTFDNVAFVSFQGSKVRLTANETLLLYAKPGPIRIDVEVDGYDPATWEGVGKAGQSVKAKFELKLSGACLPVVIAGAGLAVVGIGLGIGLAVASDAAASSADDARNGLPLNSAACAGSNAAICSGIDSDLESRDTLADGAVASIVIGSLFAAGTISYVSVAGLPGDRKATSFQFSPSVGRQHAGLLFSGRW